MLVPVEVVKEVYVDRPIEVVKYVEVSGQTPTLQDQQTTTD